MEKQKNRHKDLVNPCGGMGFMVELSGIEPLTS